MHSSAWHRLFTKFNTNCWLKWGWKIAIQGLFDGIEQIYYGYPLKFAKIEGLTLGLHSRFSHIISETHQHYSHKHTDLNSKQLILNI
jgi:hypothetical protein